MHIVLGIVIAVMLVAIAEEIGLGGCLVVLGLIAIVLFVAIGTS